jgi:hypothetical protein
VVMQLRLDEAHHHAHYRAGCVKLATFLASGICEIADQELVGRSEQVGELEVLIAQAVQAEVGNELAQLNVRDLLWPTLRVKLMCSRTS